VLQAVLAGVVSTNDVFGALYRSHSYSFFALSD